VTQGIAILHPFPGVAQVNFFWVYTLCQILLRPIKKNPKRILIKITEERSQNSSEKGSKHDPKRQ
jgi:hypothetical protein